MKRLVFLALACLSFAAVTSCDDGYTYDDTKIWEEINRINDKIRALESAVAENVTAIQSMVSLGSIESWEYDAETGKGVITLIGGKTITIDQNITGYSLVTVIEENGAYYWAVCKDGVSSPLLIDGKKVPVTMDVVPALKISDDKEWLISVDGGKTWVSTGIKYHEVPEQGDGTQQPETSVEFFKNVVKEGDYLILTLADGTSVKVAIVGESRFVAASETMWFARTGMEKSVAVEMVNVKAFTVTERPEGWKASMDEGYLFVTSPDNFDEYPKEGTVKVLATFNGNVSPEILSVTVAYEAPFTFRLVNGAFSVTMSEHTGEDFNGYVLAGWKKSEFTVAAAVKWLNDNAADLVPRKGTSAYQVSDFVADYSSADDYVIIAVPFLPAAQVVDGVMAYNEFDIQQVLFKGEESAWAVSDVRYDSATLKAVMDVEEYYGGFFPKTQWNQYGRDNFLETLKYGGGVTCDVQTYQGPANGFPTGTTDLAIEPATEYVVWYVPFASDGKYTAESFVEFEFVTPDVVLDVSMAAPAYKINDVTMSGFTAEVTPAAGAYKTYAAIVKANAIPETDIEVVRYLIHDNNCSLGTKTNTVTGNSFSSDDEVYLLAVSVTEDGKFGGIVKVKQEVESVVFTDALGVEVTGVEYGLGDATLSLAFTGNPSSITYFAATYTFYTDDNLEKMLALEQYGEAKTANVSALNGKVCIDGLTIGAEHTFYAVVRDGEANVSHLYKCVFTPSLTIDYILEGGSDYQYGMPQLSGAWSGTTYTMAVDMPSSCKKYWLFRGNSEYFTGDVYGDSDKLVTEYFMDVTVHTASETGLEYTYMNKTSRIYMVWLDDNDEFHAIYEFNPDMP